MEPFSQLEEEIFAITQQLWEVEEYLKSQKGKCRADERPDDNQTFLRESQEELRAHLRLLEDKKLSTSIALAVDSDRLVLAALAREEAQASDDRRLAIRLSEKIDDADLSATDSDVEQPQAACEPQASDDDCVAGPSITFRERQAQELEKMAVTETRCCVCFESYFAHKTRLYSRLAAAVNRFI
ncbi:hypothetical protein AbraIFM66950_009681 [Aspergillus brasiliensis]|nr:hypothetical protein AbraIFM66950_009681 [Aspergillus brasiliensis]